jgi:hypothetical protein
MNKLKISGEIDYRQYLARKMSLQENIRKMRQEQQEIIRELNGYAGSKQWLLDRGLSESDILLILRLETYELDHNISLTESSDCNKTFLVN